MIDRLNSKANTPARAAVWCIALPLFFLSGSCVAQATLDDVVARNEDIYHLGYMLGLWLVFSHGFKIGYQR